MQYKNGRSKKKEKKKKKKGGGGGESCLNELTFQAEMELNGVSRCSEKTLGNCTVYKCKTNSFIHLRVSTLCYSRSRLIRRLGGGENRVLFRQYTAFRFEPGTLKL